MWHGSFKCDMSPQLRCAWSRRVGSYSYVMQFAQMWHGSFIRDMTHQLRCAWSSVGRHSYVMQWADMWHSLFKCDMSPELLCDWSSVGSNSYVMQFAHMWHGAFILDMTYQLRCVWLRVGSHSYVMKFVHMCNTIRSHLTWLVHMKYMKCLTYQMSDELKRLKNVSYMRFIQGSQDPQDALNCRSFFAKEPLIIGLFCGKWAMKIRHLMTLRHPLYENISWCLIHEMSHI